MRQKEFLKWLLENGKKENSAASMVSRVKRIEEVYPDLDSRIEDGSIERLLDAFVYTKGDESKNRAPLHKVVIEGNQYSGTQSLRSALEEYVEFLRHDSNASGKVDVGSSDANISRDEEIYKLDEFKVWAHRDGGLTERSARAYVSYLRGLLTTLQIKKTQEPALVFVSNLLRQGKTADALKVLDLMRETVTIAMRKSEIDPHQKKSMNDERSALRKYIEFIQETLEDVPDETEFDEAVAQEVDATPMEEEASVAEVKEENYKNDFWKIDYTTDDFRPNFALRLRSQNRMSNHKDVFYPIGMVGRLFSYSDRKKNAAGLKGWDSVWFNEWLDGCVDNILVITPKGEIPVKDIERFWVNVADSKVSVELTDSKEILEVLTETAHGALKPMQATTIGAMHIDHTPLMADILSGNIAELPSLQAMSDVIKKIAEKKNISITTKNFSKISKELFEQNRALVDEKLLPLIPKLKKELAFLHGTYKLKLMQASENLAKK